LSAEERQQLLPSGASTVIGNRVGWARTYLKKAGLLESPRRGFFRLTDRGHEVLKGKPERVDVKFLERFPEFVAFRAVRHDRPTSNGGADADLNDNATPEEALETAYQRVRATLEAEVLERVKTASPAFFERLVVELLVAMGYGGSLRDAGQAVGRSGDGGIDGIIKEDRLGLDALYIQAKRWETPVSRPEIQKFAGALQGHRARKGVFITTSSFTKDANEFVSMIDRVTPLELLAEYDDENDPRRLVEYYMEYQPRFSDRLRWARASDREPKEAAEHPDPADDASRGR
jgi:restriction system protein